MWKISDGAVLSVELFTPLSGTDRAAVAGKGARLLAFAAPDATSHDVRFAQSR